MMRFLSLASVFALVVSPAASAQTCDCPRGDPAVSHVRLSYDGERFFVSGIVKDPESDKTIRGALVFTRRPSEMGAMSDSSGWFRFVVPRGDTVEVAVQYIGYKAISLTLTTANPGQDFLLTPAPVSNCGLRVGRAPEPTVDLLLRDIATGSAVRGDVSVQSKHWMSGTIVPSVLTPAANKTNLGLSSPGLYTVVAEAKGYQSVALRKVIVPIDPCSRSRIASVSYTAWMFPEK